MESYTGIQGIPEQDKAMNESMGAICDRSQEHLGTSDAMIIRARRTIINHIKAHRDQRVMPPGVDTPELYRMRSGGAIIPAGLDGMKVLSDVHFLRSDGIEQAIAVATGG